MDVQTQRALLALYVNAADRRRFLTNPRAYCEKLPPSVRDYLLALDLNEVDAFAVSLIRKRFHEALDCLGRTRRLWETQILRELFFQYAENQPIPTGVDKIAADARAFARFLQKEIPLSNEVQNKNRRIALKAEIAYLDLYLSTFLFGLRYAGEGFFYVKWKNFIRMIKIGRF